MVEGSKERIVSLSSTRKVKIIVSCVIRGKNLDIFNKIAQNHDDKFAQVVSEASQWEISAKASITYFVFSFYLWSKKEREEHNTR